MKKPLLLLSAIVTLGLTTLFLENCKDDEPDFMQVVSVTTDAGMELTGSAATGVPITGSVIVTFNKAVSAPSADQSSIALMAGDILVPSTLTVNDKSITLKPDAKMIVGSTYTISISTNLKAQDGASAATKAVDFKTFGRANVIPPRLASQLSYFPFTESMTDEGGSHTPVAADIKDLTYGMDRFGFAGLAGNFNGTTTLVEIPHGELYMTNNFTLSVWFKANSEKNGQFVLGLSAWKGFNLELATDWSWVKLTAQYANANNTSDSEDNIFSGTGETKDNGGWQGTTFQKDVQPHGGGVGTMYFKDKWVHLVCTYDAVNKLSTLYLNGEKVNQFDFNLWPSDNIKRTTTGLKFAGNLTSGGNKLALGFIQGSMNRIIQDTWADPADIYSNHFKGLMDDVRIFKVVLTSEEVAILYAAEKP
jgi:hypothetical protein